MQFKRLSSYAAMPNNAAAGDGWELDPVIGRPSSEAWCLRAAAAWPRRYAFED